LKFLKLDTSYFKRKNDEVYILKESPFEELINFDLLSTLKNAILHKKIVDIFYFSDKKYRFLQAKPLKIVFAQNNWYLAVLTDDEINGGFKFLRINFIERIIEHSKTFKIPIEAKEFLRNFQTLFSGYVDDFYEVVVEIEPEIARHFKVKKFLPSQKILKENSDGSLKISYRINNENEILLLAKQWLPYFKILSPSLKFVPASLTTKGTFNFVSLTASTTPLANTSHLMIPPKILTNTALTFASSTRIRNASVTCSTLAPPPTSKKLAGSPP
jgi:hypothetical protein